ncbi:MAG: peptidylprolyl isomerase [Bacteroidetes bacterium]|nr:peptidylprolyl isomerase [Bacteroidota bacterium]
MKKFFQGTICILFFCLLNGSASAQTLFTYGNNAVSKEEFLKAFEKNNTDKKPTEKAYRDYLELYIRYKLKVKAAYDEKTDTLAAQVAEMQNFRNQVVGTYMNDNESLNKLVNEAFARSQKDIHVGYIFIAVPKTATAADTIKLYQKAMAVYEELKKGKSFTEEVEANSDDPSAKTNRGDIGYVTAFTLPYEVENTIYNLQPSQFSKPYRNKAGYYIFKNLGERKAIGKIKVAQILIAFPPNATDSAKRSAKQKADSIYTAIKNGANFSDMAKLFSGDNISYQIGGEMAEFGTGKFDPAFENAAFALAKDGDISEPVLTNFGYHIIKRLQRKPVPSTNNKETLEGYRQRVLNDPRNEYAKKNLLQRILREANFKRAPVNEDSVWALTARDIKNPALSKDDSIKASKTFFTFAKKNVTIKEWLNYVRPIRTITKNVDKSNKELLDQFIQASAFEYYRAHLEDYNKEFAYQLNEFRDGNLLFEIMQRKIWDKASADSTGLKNYFEAHKGSYFWQPSADAVLFTCSSEKTATDIRKKLQQEGVKSWKKMVDSSAGLAQADSGRFELPQLPMAEQKTFSAGQLSSMSTNQTDNTVTFAYIVKMYNEREPRNYNDAKGFVINDYQSYLEDNWITELKKKYPVKVNEAVLKSLPK